MVWGLMALIPMNASGPKGEHLIAVFSLTGMGIAVIGMIVGLIGRPRLILAIVPASVGVLFFWIGSTLP